MPQSAVIIHTEKRVCVYTFDPRRHLAPPSSADRSLSCWSSSIPQCTAAVLGVHVKPDSHRRDRAADIMSAVEVAVSGLCVV